MFGKKTKKSSESAASEAESQDQVNRKKQSKFDLSLIPEGVDFTVGILWNGLLLLTVLAVLFFATIVYGDFMTQRAAGILDEESDRLYFSVQNKLRIINQQAAEIVADNPDNEQIVELIKRKIKGTLRVARVVEPIDELEPNPVFPGLNFATLDMVKQTSKSQQEQLPEIHLYKQKNQYLNFVYIQKPNKSYVIVSYPVSAILDVNKKIKLGDLGVISLIQKSGDWSNIILQSWGAKDDGISFSNNERYIPNSHFYIDYGVKQPQAALMDLGLISAIVCFLAALLLCTLVFIKRGQKFAALRAVHAEAKERKQERYVPSFEIEEGEFDELPENVGDFDDEQKPKLPIQQATGVLDRSIFKAYDIRGIVDETLTTSAVEQIGQAIGTENINRGRRSIVVARDGRLSGPTLLDALIKGLRKSGCDVINIGAVPTGVLYFATHYLETGSGVMLTGSHNPANYNGLKIMLDGETLAGKSIQALYKAIVAGNLLEGEGDLQDMDIADDYVDEISADIQLEHRPKVVVDCGNGIPGEIAPELLEEIGCDVIPLHCDVDGSFPNHHPDPSVPENLQDLIATLRSVDADIGIAFDGDGDRLGVVTKAGEIIYPDRLMMLFAKDVLSREPGSSIIFDVKCTGHLPKSIVKSGGMPIMWKTGHSFMKAKLKETNASLAGEMSGHFFFKERWYGFDDGLYAAARLLEILDQDERLPQEIFDELPKGVSTPELKVHMKEGEHYEFIEKFINSVEFGDAKVITIDGIRADYADGWGLVRCSNTTPCLVIRFDADNQQALDRIQDEFRRKLLAVDAKLDLPF